MTRTIIFAGVISLLNCSAMGSEQLRQILCKVPDGAGHFLAAEYVQMDFSIGFTQLCRMNQSGQITERFNMAVNEKVHSMALLGDHIYLGGNFSAFGDTLSFYNRTAYLAKFDSLLTAPDTSFPSFNYPVKHLIQDKTLGLFVFGQFGKFHTNGATEVLWIEPDGGLQEFSIPSLIQIHDALVVNKELVVCGHFLGSSRTADSVVAVDLTNFEQRGIQRCWKSTHDIVVRTWQGSFILSGYYRDSAGQVLPEVIQFDPLNPTKSQRAFPLSPARFQDVQIRETALFISYGYYVSDPDLQQKVLKFDLESRTPCDTIKLSGAPGTLSNVRWIGNEYIYLFESIRGYSNTTYHYAMGRVSVKGGEYERLAIVFDEEVYFVKQTGNQLILAGRFEHVNDLSRRGLAYFDLETGQLTEQSMNTSQAVSGLWQTDAALYVGGSLIVGGTSCSPLIRYTISTGEVENPYPLLHGKIQEIRIENKQVQIQGEYLQTRSGDSYLNKLSLEIR